MDAFFFPSENQFGKGNPLFADEVPTITEVKVGLFLNKILVTWLAKEEGPQYSTVVLEGSIWDETFYNPATSLMLRESDELVLAARVTDNYGRTQFVWVDGVMVEDNSITHAETPKDRNLDPDQWEFWE